MTPPPSESTGQSASLAETLASKRRNAAANRRATGGPPTKFYPAMLIASTLVSAGFCALYITKPVVMTFQEGDLRVVEAPPVAAIDLAAGDVGGMELSPSGEVPAHEETNLRVQHVLNASTKEGELSRIVLDVPVIYASRQLRWTHEEVENARAFHARLADFHEQSRNLRELGQSLLAEWNGLIERSIPMPDLRADSPSLPDNQEGAKPLTRPAELDTTEVIEIQPNGQ